MAQTILFKDSFDGASGALIASRPAVVGSWESGGFSLTGAGSATSPSGVAKSSVINPPPSAPGLLRISCEFSSDLSEGGTFWVGLHGDDYNLFANIGIFQSGSGLGAYVETSADFIETTVAQLGSSNTLVVEFGNVGIDVSLNGAATLSSPPESGLLGAPDFRVVVGCYTATTVFDVDLVADPEEDTTGTNATATAASPLGSAKVHAAVSAASYARASSPLGLPSAKATVSVAMPLGVCTTQSGVPYAVAGVSPVGVSTTQYGAIIAAYDVTVNVAPTEPTTRYGVPLAWMVDTYLLGTIHGVSGSHTTEYGVPSAEPSVSVNVLGASTTAYGHPTAVAGASPEGVSTTSYGQPTARAIASVHGHHGTRYGTPSVPTVHDVAGASTTKYGKPTAIRPGAHLVYGCNNGRRAGVPSAREIT